jgi:hypothetical protein
MHHPCPHLFLPVSNSKSRHFSPPSRLKPPDQQLHFRFEQISFKYGTVMTTTKLIAIIAGVSPGKFNA